MQPAEGNAKPVAKVVGKIGDKAAIAKTYKLSDWNDYVIICKGNHVQQYLNGILTVDFTDNDEKGRCDSGILALQIHAGAPMWVVWATTICVSTPSSAERSDATRNDTR